MIMHLLGFCIILLSRSQNVTLSLFLVTVENVKVNANIFMYFDLFRFAVLGGILIEGTTHTDLPQYANP